MISSVAALRGRLATDDDRFARLTRLMIRHRRVVVACWLAAMVAGTLGALRLTPLLRSDFALPGTDSARVDQILADHFPTRSTSVYVLVAPDRSIGALRRVARTAGDALPGGRVEELERLPSGAAVAFVSTTLKPAAAAARVGELRSRVGPSVNVTGDPAVQHDLEPVLARDLKDGELYLAVPAAFAILLFAFGTASALLPFVFAAATIPPSLGLAWLAAHELALSSYLRNMVMMVGLGIAIDYSLLIVNRYRDERRHGAAHEEAVERTLASAGRTIVFSSLAVSVGLALMLVLPVPFLRGFGLGGLLVPAVSLVCALTLLPVLLHSFGSRLERTRIVPRRLAERRDAGEQRLWAAHARFVMRRAKILAPAAAAVLVLAALPLVGIQVGPGSASSLPSHLPALKGLDLIEAGSGSDPLNPTTVVVDAGKGGSVRIAAVAAAVGRLRGELEQEREVARLGPVEHDRSGRYLRFSVTGRHDAASQQAQRFAATLRGPLVRAADFPGSVRVLAGGGAASAADFVDRTLGSFPWLVLGVLGLTYVLLLRAFRSLLLPLKAIVLNFLTVAAASGLQIAFFQWGWGRWLGLTQVPRIEGWIPVFMFALLFGLSMDYEVFLVHRMREAWLETRSNAAAVVHGLSHTGRVVTAAGLVMCATFSGFLLGSIPPMQQLGFGLAVAIAIDITVVRGILLPSAMAIAGRWNWYLPVWTARLLRLAD